MVGRFGLSKKAFGKWILVIGVLTTLGRTGIFPPPAHASTWPNQEAANANYLLITANHLVLLQQKVAAQAPEWVELKNNVDAEMGTIDYYACSPENIALVYLLTKDAKYAIAALEWARDTMKLDVRFDSYLLFGEYMRRVALVLNYCWEALTAAQRLELATYLDDWTYELWFNNQGSGWGLNDPGNNYHMAFLEGTAFAGYALREAGYAPKEDYLAVLLDKLNRADGVMNYVNTRARGGDWHEGVNYGERSKQRLYAALSVIASMDGVNYFTQSPFFANSIYYAFYQLQPGNKYIYPGGDLPRISNMTASPYERDYIQSVVYWLPDGKARRYGQWYLTKIVPAYADQDGTWAELFYKDMIFKLNLPSRAQKWLPLSYRAAGTNWLNFRSGWNAGATCVSLSGMPIYDQSHAHLDAGSFTIWKKDWLALDANTFNADGLLWQPGAHNMLHVTGSEMRLIERIPGLSRYWDEAMFSYVRVDGTNLFRKRGDEEDILLMAEWTREFVYLKPDTVVVYDRAKPKPGNTYNLRFHFPVKPVLGSGRYTASYHGGGISLIPLVSGALSILRDKDLGDPPGSTAWRVQENPAIRRAGRFLNILQVAAGAPPALAATHVTTTTNVMEGALWETDVVLFSSKNRGATPALPFAYTLPGTGVRTHTLLNMSGSYDVEVLRTGGNTTVTVTSGATYNATKQGVLRFTL